MDKITKKYTLTKEEFQNFFDTYITALDCWDGNHNKWVFNLQYTEEKKFKHSNSKSPSPLEMVFSANLYYKISTTKPEDLVDLMFTEYFSFLDGGNNWEKMRIPNSIEIAYGNNKTNYPLLLTTDHIDSWSQGSDSCRSTIINHMLDDLNWIKHNAEEVREWVFNRVTWQFSCKFINSPVQFRFTTRSYPSTTVPDKIDCEMIQRVDTNLLESIYNRIKITKNNDENKSDSLG